MKKCVPSVLIVVVAFGLIGCANGEGGPNIDLGTQALDVCYVGADCYSVTFNMNNENDFALPPADSPIESIEFRFGGVDANGDGELREDELTHLTVHYRFAGGGEYVDVVMDSCAVQPLVTSEGDTLGRVLFESNHATEDVFFQFLIPSGQLRQIRTVAAQGAWRNAEDFGGYFVTVDDGADFITEPSAKLKRRHSNSTLSRSVEFTGNEASEEGTCDGADICGEHQVAICHIPPGNPDNRHGICVGAPAVDTHVVRHGDLKLTVENKDQCG